MKIRNLITALWLVVLTTVCIGCAADDSRTTIVQEGTAAVCIPAQVGFTFPAIFRGEMCVNPVLNFRRGGNCGWGLPDMSPSAAVSLRPPGIAPDTRHATTPSALAQCVRTPIPSSRAEDHAFATVFFPVASEAAQYRSWGEEWWSSTILRGSRQANGCCMQSVRFQSYHTSVVAQRVGGFLDARYETALSHDEYEQTTACGAYRHRGDSESWSIQPEAMFVLCRGEPAASLLDAHRVTDSAVYAAGVGYDPHETLKDYLNAHEAPAVGSVIYTVRGHRPSNQP